MTEKILVADIGGTSARFALVPHRIGRLIPENVKTLPVKDFDNLQDAVKAYLRTIGARPVLASFAVAGPVTEKSVEFTNSSWRLHLDTFKAVFGFDRFIVMNDFEALARSIPHLTGDDFLPVKPGTVDPRAPRLVMGPGTGMGQALIVPFDGADRIISTEGGHVSFAPHTDEEFEILKMIGETHRHVSIERLLSGQGLINIYQALCTLRKKPGMTLSAEEISRAAIEEKDPMAVNTVNMFCAMLGRVAGDAVLSAGARGGVFLGGGILPKIKEIFLKSDFIDRFLDKGRMRCYLDDVPVQMIVGKSTALVGAAAAFLESDAKSA